MVEIPLYLRLKKQSHKDIALAQDKIIKIVSEIFDNYVLHGGTAIWRCYGGKRFSEDIDVYIPRNLKKIDDFFNKLVKEGFVIEKKKISENSIYSNLVYEKTYVRFEAIFKNVKGVLKDYESCDGNFITIYGLEGETLIEEKINAYKKRRKIRDLYDIFYLLKYVKKKNLICDKLKNFLRKYKKPEDEGDLKILILEGIVPDSDKLLEYIKN